MKVVPLHCLVILVGAGDRERQLAQFPAHEIVSQEAISREMTGPNLRFGTEEVIHSEIMRRMSAKLRLGERVVVDAYMDRQRRLTLANMGRAVGVPVFYLILRSSDAQTARGDGVAEVIDGRDSVASPVPSRATVTDQMLMDRYQGVTVIGDVHGMYSSLQTAIRWARDRNQFIVLLGDVLDYGPDTLEVTDEVYRLVMRGEARCILGNHERKIMRWIDGHRVRLSEGNRTTTQALSQLGDTAKARWIGRFRGLYQNSRLIDSIKNVTFAHGAIHPDFWTGKDSKVIENTAFFGEVDDIRSQPERPIRSYRWVDSIPGGSFVVVGHDRRAASPFVQTNTAEGKAVFLDTGSGKGGSLSSADFRFTTEGLRLENFNMY